MSVAAVALGAAVVLAVGVPVAIVGALVLDEGSAGVFPLAGVVVVGVGAGGWLAGTRASSAPMPHAVVGGVLGFAGAQALSAVLLVVRDRDVSVAALGFNVAVAVAVAAVGGWVASSRRSGG